MFLQTLPGVEIGNRRGIPNQGLEGTFWPRDPTHILFTAQGHQCQWLSLVTLGQGKADVHRGLTARGYTQEKATNRQHLATPHQPPLRLWATLGLLGGSCPPPAIRRGPPGCQGHVTVTVSAACGLPG